MNPATLLQFQTYGQKMAGELDFAEPGKDNGLLPINSFLCLIEESLFHEQAPEPLARGVRVARKWIDEIFDGTGKFRQSDLERFGHWTDWWLKALQAATNQSDIPELPETDGKETTGQTVLPVPALGPNETAPVRTNDPLPLAPSTQGGEREVANAEAPDFGSAGASACQDRPSSQAPTNSGEPSLTLNLEQDRDFLGQFIAEATEHLQNIEQGVLGLETNPSDAETLNLVFRAFHTLKSSAGFLSLDPIQALAHELESLLEMARKRHVAITRPLIDVSLSGADALKQFAAQIAAQLDGSSPPGPIVVPTLALIEQVRAAQVLSAAIEPAAIPAADGLPAAPQSDSLTEVSSATIKVEKTKLDNLVDLLGEMMLAQAELAQRTREDPVRNVSLGVPLARLARLSKELQATAMSLRMVPIRKTFQKMQRLTRDLAARERKNVCLETEGEEAELDRALVEQISDPLVHMIRNCVDHGIEKPEVRQQRGKPESGLIRLNAFHQGGNFVLELSDDGNGLDKDRILAKATSTGLIKPKQTLSEREVFNLIMAPGFSTTEKITDLSGRGVGLDVVRKNVEALRGSIEIHSTPGRGTTFTIQLPLKLAILDGLIAAVGGQRFIIPAHAVAHTFRLAPNEIKTIQGRGEMVETRGKLRPLLRLGGRLGLPPTEGEMADSMAVLVECGGQSRCVLVDQLLGKEEVVAKGFEPGIRPAEPVCGAAILGDGLVGLILDPHALVNGEPRPLEAAA